MNLWICGLVKKETPDGPIWEFVGIFDSENLAAKACKGMFYFIAQVGLNEVQPTEIVEFKNVRWPRLEGSG